MVTPHKSIHGKIDEWPSLLVDKLKRQFDIHFVKYGFAGASEQQDKGVPAIDTDIVSLATSLEDKAEYPAFSLLYLDPESFLHGHDPLGRLGTSLRKLVSCSRTCIIARQSRQVVLSCLPGLLDRACIGTPGHLDILTEERCNSIPDATYDPYRRIQHRNFLHAEKYTPLTTIDRAFLEGRNTEALEEHLDAVVDTIRRRQQESAPLTVEPLIKSTGLLWLRKARVDLRRIANSLSFYAALDTLSVIAYGEEEGEEQRDLDIGTIYPEQIFDDSSRPPDRLPYHSLSRLIQSDKSFDLLFLPDAGDQELTVIQDTSLLAALKDLTTRTRAIIAQGSSVLLLAGAGLLHSSVAISGSHLDRAKSLYPDIEWTLSKQDEEEDCIVLVQGEILTPGGISLSDQDLPSVILAGQYRDRSQPAKAASDAIERAAKRPRKEVEPGPPLATLTWSELLARIDRSYEAKGGSGGLTAPEGANDASLAAVEARIGESLPSDLRAFLSLSDGLGQIDLEDFDFPGLRRTNELDWDSNAEAAGLPLVVEPEFTGDDSVIDRLPTMPATGLLQLCDEEEDVWLVSPRLVKEARDRVSYKGPREVGWRVLTWQHWCPENPELFLSFREYMEHLCKKVEET